MQDSPHCNVMDDFDLTRCYEVLTGCSLSNCCGHTGTHEKLLHQMQRAVQWINSQVVKNQVHISFSNKQLKVTYSHMNYVNSLILVHKCIYVHLWSSSVRAQLPRLGTNVHRSSYLWSGSSWDPPHYPVARPGILNPQRKLEHSYYTEEQQPQNQRVVVSVFVFTLSWQILKRILRVLSTIITQDNSQ